MFKKVTIIVLSLFFVQILFLKLSFAYFGPYSFEKNNPIEIGVGFAPKASPALKQEPVRNLDIAVNPDGTFEFLPINLPVSITKVEVPVQTPSDSDTKVEYEGGSSESEPSTPGVNFKIEEQRLSIGNVDVKVGGDLVVSHRPDGSVTGFSEVALAADAEMALSGDVLLSLGIDSEGNIAGDITVNGEIIDSATLSVSRDEDGTWQISGVEGTYIIDRWFEGVFELGSAGDWRVTAGDHLPGEGAAAGGSGGGDEGLGSSLFSELENSLDETGGGMSKDEILDVIRDVVAGLVPDEAEDKKTEGLDFPVDGWFLELTPEQQKLAVECIKERLAVELSAEGFDVNEIKLHIGMAEGVNEDGEPIAIISFGLRKGTESLGTYLDVSNGSFNMHVDRQGVTATYETEGGGEVTPSVGVREDGILGGIEYEHKSGVRLELQGVSLHGVVPIETKSGKLKDNINLSVPLCFFGIDVPQDVAGTFAANPSGVRLGVSRGNDYWDVSLMEGMLGFSASAVDPVTGLKQTVIISSKEWEWKVSLGNTS